jgi:hypothetical protein
MPLPTRIYCMPSSVVGLRRLQNPMVTTRSRLFMQTEGGLLNCLPRCLQRNPLPPSPAPNQSLTEMPRLPPHDRIPQLSSIKKKNALSVKRCRKHRERPITRDPLWNQGCSIPSTMTWTCVSCYIKRMTLLFTMSLRKAIHQRMKKLGMNHDREVRSNYHSYPSASC